MSGKDLPASELPLSRLDCTTKKQEEKSKKINPASQVVEEEKEALPGATPHLSRIPGKGGREGSSQNLSSNTGRSQL